MFLAQFLCHSNKLPSSMPPLAYANYAMGSPQVGFFFRVEPPTILYLMYVWCPFWCLLFTFRCQVGCRIHLWGAQPLGFAPLQPFGVYPWQAYVHPGDGHQSTPGMHRVAAPSATLGRGEPSASHLAVPQLIGGVCSLCHLIPLPSLHDGEGSSFLGLVPSDDAVDSDSVMSIKPGDSSVVIGYQVDEFTHAWSAEQFVACSTFILGSLDRCHH